MRFVVVLIFKGIMALKDIKERCMRWGMIVRLSFLRKSILDPKIFMCDCVFLDGCLSHFLL